MRGIDVSSHDGYGGGIFSRRNTESCYADSDFVIVKATQSTNYTYGGYRDVAARVQRDGKLLGFYHYAGGKDPVAEADFFVSKVKGFVGEAILCLDWESGMNKSWGDETWCRRFCARVHELTGVWCLIYVQASAVAQAASCADVCGLWVAGYPDNRNSWDVPRWRYSVKPWDGYTVWQYSSSNELTDRNTSNLSREQWLAIAKGEDMAITNDDANTMWAFNNYGEGGHQSAWTNLIDTNLRVQEIQAQCAALSEAVKVLAESKGADPEQIAKEVSDAVAAKLEKIELDVKVGE